jgi:hypothetical protein
MDSDEEFDLNASDGYSDDEELEARETVKAENAEKVENAKPTERFDLEAEEAEEECEVIILDAIAVVSDQEGEEDAKPKALARAPRRQSKGTSFKVLIKGDDEPKGGKCTHCPLKLNHKGLCLVDMYERVPKRRRNN